MKHIIGCIIAATMLSLGLAVPAQADSEGYVTRGEFRKVRLGSYENPERGMRVSRVAQLFDTKGRLDHQGGGYMGRTYRTANPEFKVTISYQASSEGWHAVYKTWWRPCPDC